MSGSAGLFNNFFFTSSGAQRWAEREMGNTKENTATLMHMPFDTECQMYINITCVHALINGVHLMTHLGHVEGTGRVCVSFNSKMIYNPPKGMRATNTTCNSCKQQGTSTQAVTVWMNQPTYGCYKTDLM